MTEIVMDIVPIGILHIEIGFHPTFSRHDRIEASFILFIWLNEKVLIPLGHRIILMDIGNHMDAIIYLTGLVNQDKSFIVYLRPFRSDAMQIPSFGKELAAYRIRRDDDFCSLVLLQEIP